MSEHGNEPAYPVMPPLAETGHSANGYPWPSTGLTRREAFAIAALQGILANRTYEPPRRNKLPGMAQDAVAAADALLAELAKEPTR